MALLERVQTLEADKAVLAEQVAALREGYAERQTSTQPAVVESESDLIRKESEDQLAAKNQASLAT